MHYAIIGNGICGIEAALALRSRDRGCRITIVSDEHDHLFSRPALMYVFAGQMSLRDTEPFDRRFYERSGFDRVSGHVVAVDAGAKSLRFDDGRTLGYDRLLLAAGSRGRRAPWPGADGPGIHYFVTLRDLEVLDAAARKGMRVVVIGGGLIGVESAEILHHRGLHVAFVIRENWYFPAALDSREAALVGEHMTERGVDVRLGASVASFERRGSTLTGVRLASGETVPCDLAVCAIGVEPNTGFLRGGPISLSRSGAIEVDDALRTNLPDVWAAGDCANVTWNDGTRRPEQLWYTARDQGRIAARSMMGENVRYDRGTWYNSAKFFDLEWTTAGYVPALADADGREVPPPPGMKSWFQRVPGRFESQKVVHREARVVGFNMLGSRWDHEVLLRFIEDGRSLDFVLEHLGDAQFDEEFSPPFRVLQEAVAP